MAAVNQLRNELIEERMEAEPETRNERKRSKKKEPEEEKKNFFTDGRFYKIIGLFFILFTVLAYNILGEALRDILEPRLKE